MENNDRAVDPPGGKHLDPPDFTADAIAAAPAVTEPLSVGDAHTPEQNDHDGAPTADNTPGDDADADADSDTVTDTDADADADADSDTDTHADADSDTDSGSEAEPGSGQGSPGPEPEPEPEPEPTVYARIADTCTALVDAVAQVEKLEARQAAWKAEFIDRARTLALTAEEGVLVTARSRTVVERQDLALRSFIAELACTLRVAERTATALVEESDALLNRLPVTLGALREGEISYRHAQVLVDQVSTLSDDAAAELEERAVPFAKTMTVSRFRQKTRMLRERLCPESAVARCRKSVTDRRVELIPAPDGMAWFNLFTTAPVAETIFDTIRAQSMRLQSPVETRTLSQLDADVVFAAMMEAFTGEYSLPDPTGTRLFGTGLGIRNPYTDPYPAEVPGIASELAFAPVTSASVGTSADIGAAGSTSTSTSTSTSISTSISISTSTSTSTSTSERGKQPL